MYTVKLIIIIIIKMAVLLGKFLVTNVCSITVVYVCRVKEELKMGRICVLNLCDFCRRINRWSHVMVSFC